MKMKVFSFENDIIFSEEYISVLQIEEKILFTRIIESINSKILDIEDENMENIVDIYNLLPEEINTIIRKLTNA